MVRRRVLDVAIPLSKGLQSLSLVDWSLASRSTSTAKVPSSQGCDQTASGQMSIFTRMSHGSPGVNVCMISSTSPTSWAWPTTSTPNPVMAEWTSVSVSFSMAKDLRV